LVGVIEPGLKSHAFSHNRLFLLDNRSIERDGRANEFLQRGFVDLVAFIMSFSC